MHMNSIIIIIVFIIIAQLGIEILLTRHHYHATKSVERTSMFGSHDKMRYVLIGNRPRDPSRTYCKTMHLCQLRA